MRSGEDFDWRKYGKMRIDAEDFGWGFRRLIYLR